MGRRRRNAYWSTAGGVAPVDATIHSNQLEITPVEQLTEPEPTPAMNTRRSLRQQAKKAAQVSLAEDDFVDVEGSDEDFALYAPVEAPAPRKRFLKDKGRKKGDDSEESTAAVLNRLINKRTAKPGYVVKSGRFNVQKRKTGMTSGRSLQGNSQKRSPAVASSSVRPPMPQLLPAPNLSSFNDMSPMPLKVEIQEGIGTVNSDGPKKRGRKRKVDLPMNLSMKTESGGVPIQQQPQVQQKQKDPDWDPTANMQRKRGRQSAATAIVKNRFPFCTLCLSKTPPSDYIINHMSCPNEYQRMKRLFMYIYKDLRFPFMPFDLERENVFDYCDLPLCDCCIQLYREIYDSYCQIETARDQLKSRIERMVYQIQLSEQNPAVAQQLGSIKNSPDALMNKYCNFRRRFASYKPGDSRGEVQGAALVPATIARIKVINQTPKRTSGTQTFLTAGHFPASTPDLPTATAQNAASKPKEPEPANKTNTAGASSSATVSTSNGSIGTVVIKKEPVESPPSLPSKPQSSNAKTAVTATTTNPSKVQSSQKPIPKITPPTTVSPKVPLASTKTSTPSASPKLPVVNTKVSTPTVNPVKPKPAPHASVLTIIKTPGGAGPAIIRKLPVKPSIFTQPAKLLAIATPTHKLPASRSNAVPAKPIGNGSTEKTPQSATSKSPPEKQKSNSVAPTVKDEPIDPDEVVSPTEEEQDPFFSLDPSTGLTSSNKEGSSTEGEESNSQSQSDNVFHKHKKLRVLPVPSYKDSSNDSSDMTSDDKEGQSKVNNNEDGKDGDKDKEAQEKSPDLSKEKESESTKPGNSASKPETSTSQDKSEN